MDNSNRDKKANELISCLVRCTPEEIFGLVRLMGIKALDREGKLRDGEDVVMDIVNGYLAMNRVRQRNFMKLLRKTVKGRSIERMQNAASRKMTECDNQQNDEVAANDVNIKEATNGTPTESC